jgi:hypothetical protein
MSTNLERQPSERDAVAYIGDLSSALAQLARQHKLAALSYLFQLAQMEAENARAGHAPARVPAASAQNGATEPQSESFAK